MKGYATYEEASSIPAKVKMNKARTYKLKSLSLFPDLGQFCSTEPFLWFKKYILAYHVFI